MRAASPFAASPAEVPKKMSPKTVVLAGATGNLGGLIAAALVEKGGVTVRALVRPGSAGKLGELAARGVEVIETPLERTAHEALTAALRGAFSVVSALQGGLDVIVDAQSALLDAARAAGVRRFLPSDFSFDFFGLDDGDNLNSDWRRAFARHAAAHRGDVEVVHVQNGCFLDAGVLFGFLGAFDLARGEVYLWGDGAQPMDFTTYADTARYAAEAATDDGAVPERFAVAGETVDFAGLVAAYEAGSGRKLTVVHRGSLEEMHAEILRRQSAAPENVFGYLPLMYWRGMLNGKGKLGALSNARYPHIRPEGIAAYVRRMGV